MASRIIPAFTGPLTPTALDAWLGQCEDGFAIYAATKSDKSPELDVVTKIRLTGSNLLEPSMAAWWFSNRAEALKHTTWEALKTQIRTRFIPKGHKMHALHKFFLCAQGSVSFLDYAATLADARNAVGSTVISVTIYKYHLLFHAHPVLVLRILALPDFNIDSTGFDDLVALMSMQYDSMLAEGNTSRLSAGARTSSIHSLAPSIPRLPPLDDAERDRLSAARGCWKCRKVPTDAGWVPHVGRTCPGDPEKGVLPGRDFVPEVKREPLGAVFMALSQPLDDEEQPDFDDVAYYSDAHTEDV